MFIVNSLHQDPADTYDPGGRAWYPAATGQSSRAWTSPYILFTTRRPGVTPAMRVMNEEPFGPLAVIAPFDSLDEVIDEGARSSEREGASIWRQLTVLTVREDKSRRGQNLTAINAAQMLVMAILTAMFWWRMPDDTDAFVMERFSILFFCIIAQSNAVVFACVNTFAKERQLMIRENAKGMYHPLPFFLAKTASDTVNTLVMPCLYATVTYWCVGLKQTAEAYFVFITAFALCILVAQSLGLALSCAIPDVQVSLIVAPMVILMLMILGGFYVTFSNMPVFIRWLSWCSQARFGFTAMVVNEFREGCSSVRPRGTTRGTGLSARLGEKTSSRRWRWTISASDSVCWRWR